MGKSNELWILRHICRIIFNIYAVFPAIQGEEVAVQDNADAFEQTCIDAFALEDVIHIGAGYFMWLRPPDILNGGKIFTELWREAILLPIPFLEQAARGGESCLNYTCELFLSFPFIHSKI